MEPDLSMFSLLFLILWIFGFINIYFSHVFIVAKISSSKQVKLKCIGLNINVTPTRTIRQVYF